MIYSQFLLDLHEEIIVDLFAGGGGASCGIEMATGRQVDIAINHDAAAVALHQANHPQTRHKVCDVFEADPREVAQGRPIGLLWASPDCTHHSKARGGKPLRDKARKRRALAWVVTRWAGQVRPRVIMLENVEEFAKWGPLVGPANELRPCRRRAGRTYRTWKRSLERLGYVVEQREMRACDYGAPTIRKRLFIIARCDGQPIVWPAATHGPSTRKPYRTAAECIDWSVPMLSIFATRKEAKAWGKQHGQAAPVRPLAEATLKRIARGVMRYVVNAARPFIVNLTHHGHDRNEPLTEPFMTITGAQRGEKALVAPYLVPHYGENPGQQPRVRDITAPLPTVVPTENGGSLCVAQLSTYYGDRPGQRIEDLDEPLRTQTTENRHAVVASFLAKHYGGVVGSPLHEPKATVTTIDHDSLVAAHIQRDFGTSTGHSAEQPLATITGDGGGKAALVAAHLMNNNTGHPGATVDSPAPTATSTQHAALVYSFLQAYYGTHQDGGLTDPIATVTTHDRFGLVTVTVNGEPYYIADIAMRMLQPRELYNAQGFPPSYQITCKVWDAKRKRMRWLTKTEQVRMVGNSVCPPIAAALVRANLPELRARDEVAA